MRKVAIALLAVFLGFWIYTDPPGAAGFAQSAGGGAWGAATQLFGAVIDFIGAL